MAWMANGVHRFPLVADSATSLLLVACTPGGSGQEYPATFLLRFPEGFDTADLQDAKALLEELGT
jgi:hypothetical protein